MTGKKEKKERSEKAIHQADPLAKQGLGRGKSFDQVPEPLGEATCRQQLEDWEGCLMMASQRQRFGDSRIRGPFETHCAGNPGNRADGWRLGEAGKGHLVVMTFSASRIISNPA